MTQEERIKQMYAANLASQKEALQQDYQKADADYVQQQEAAKKATDANLTRTAVEAQKAAINNAEVNAASGLSSGARALQRLSNENQTRSDMATLRAQQQEADVDIERARSQLSQEYASAIRKAQQDNDLALAEALYAEAQRQEELLRADQKEKEALLRADQKEKEALLRADQKEKEALLREEQERERQNALTAAQLLAQTGNYSRLAQIYGLSEAEIAALVAADEVAKNEVAAAAQDEKAVAAAQLLAQTGDYARLGKLYGLTDEEVTRLNAMAIQQHQEEGESVTAPEGGDNKSGGNSPLTDTLSKLGNAVGSWFSNVFSGNTQNDDGSLKIENTKNTDYFIKVIPTRIEYAHTYAKDGQYSSYAEYIESKLDEWLQRGDLTESEVATLIVHYGLL